MSLSAIGKVPMLALLAGLLSTGCVNAGSAIENQEYGFTASIPDRLPVCMRDVLTHVHGAGTVLVGKSCENPQGLPAFGIWADYNTTFQKDAVEVLRGNPVCSGGNVSWAEEEWSNAIGGLKTAMCRVDHQSGKIDIVLGAQVGQWSKEFEEDAPYINYTVYFNSTRSRLDSGDMRVFKAFLRSIEITR